ncbi:putative fatty acyl-CoA reductase CG5065 [Calliopsis andreniformis]|uniref:putative fatty acyl-CoA reductase CG5065 n=1 Tax=Calliopsis andreniformis TaxID=337506 RepID=UPI003FCCBD0D
MGTTNAQTNPKHGNDEAYINGGSIEAFFAESVILLTGATGFLGKALLEKLLRSCPRLATIFILIRPKQGHTIEQRFKRLLENSVFDRIRADCPDVFNKIYPVKGDVTLPNLGLSPEDRNMLTQRVNIVFHSAATVKFNEPLKVAVNLNTKGTDRVIELCRNMTNLISVIHVSTAYSNANRREINESIYTTKVKPSTVIDMCESLDDETLKILEKKILENHPNTYTFTKNLAEQIILTKAKDLPIAIVRPSIVCAAQEEPFPGWVDNLCGITGVMMEIGRGTVRSVICDPNLKLNIVPIDYVVDTLICASWHSTMQHNNAIKVYNCTTSVETIRWGSFNDIIKKHAIEWPSKRVVWYPGVTFRTNKFMHSVASTILHVFPAFVVDFFLRLLGSKPIMMKMVKRFKRAVDTGAFFSTHEWEFNRSNMDALTKEVKALKDGDHFNTDMHGFDWDTYVRHYTLGIRKFILKETPESIREARNRLVMLYWLHRFTQVSSIIILLAMIKRVGH